MTKTTSIYTFFNSTDIFSSVYCLSYGSNRCIEEKAVETLIKLI